MVFSNNRQRQRARTSIPSINPAANPAILNFSKNLASVAAKENFKWELQDKDNSGLARISNQIVIEFVVDNS
jgi:hypothetical protein